MAHHIVEEPHAVLPPDGKDSPGDLFEEAGAAPDGKDLLGSVWHRSDYNMGFQPEQVERVGESALRVRWADGHDSIYPWPLLRAACPCAACREGPPLKQDPSVKAAEIKPVGHYAMAIRWSDGHATGIFSHEYLRSLCSCEACKPEQLMEG